MSRHSLSEDRVKYEDFAFRRFEGDQAGCGE